MISQNEQVNKPLIKEKIIFNNFRGYGILQLFKNQNNQTPSLFLAIQQSLDFSTRIHEILFIYMCIFYWIHIHLIRYTD